VPVVHINVYVFALFVFPLLIASIHFKMICKTPKALVGQRKAGPSPSPSNIKKNQATFSFGFLHKAKLGQPPFRNTGKYLKAKVLFY
jgi:hypothetical protein